MKVNTFQLKTCCLGVLLLLFVYKFGDIMADDERELGIINVLAVFGFAQWVCCDGFGLGLWALNCEPSEAQHPELY